MADYFAVLSRTLSGFGEPKPELRSKLYERARMTIRRQLDSHTPPLDDAALNAEMNKLEEAIRKVEKGFGPPNVTLENPEQEAKPKSEPAQPVEEKKTESSSSKVDEKTEDKPDKPEKKSEAKEAEQEAEAEPVPTRKEKRAAAKAQREEEKAAKAKSAKKAEPAPEKPSSDKPAEDTTISDKGSKVAATEPDKPAISETDKAADPVEPENQSKPVAENEVVDPMDEWAREFLTAQEASKPEVAEALAEMQSDREKSGADNKQDADERAASIAAAATAAAATPSKAKPALDLPVFDSKQDDTIIIPPVPTVEPEKKRGGIGKWLLMALSALLLVGAVFLGLNWENRSQIASSIGLDGLFGDTVEPRPVKTITITPDPEPTPEPEPAVEAPTAPEPDTPKSEERLGSDEEPLEPATPAPEPPATVDPASPPTQNDDAAAEQPAVDPEQPAAELPAADAGASPAVAQSAILYEEGGSSSENSFDTGRVVWSVVEEQGGEGEGKIPAIRGRVEVPSRQLVLIMTIKRNTDRALPASHLIELVFAVPDDFSGGSIGEISRYVLKENEQGRGDALIGVPARIADGIFLIALNNLDSAKKSNEQLLRTRSWIDVPMAYRTGRRALITLEKGVPGEAVFKEVFDAWDELDNRP